jgi:hypothetical protein
MEEAYEGRTVYTGSRGDFVWERLGFRTPWWTMVSFGLTEYRLRVGYIHMAPCAIGEEHRRRIEAISRSQSMQPWSLRNFYDRPIPRRILEDAGVPRSLFGKAKKATSHAPMFGSEGMTEKSAIDFEAFASACYEETADARRLGFRFQMLLARQHRRAQKRLAKLSMRSGLRLEIPSKLPHRYHRAPSMSHLSFLWGLETSAARYGAPHR